LLDRAAAVSAINERIERIGSSTKEVRLFHKLTAKSRPGKKYRSLAEPALFMKEAGDGGNSRAMAAHCASDQHEKRSGTMLIHRPRRLLDTRRRSVGYCTLTVMFPSVGE
jgi:hypothetical protein